jgi:hypothetical protein
MAWFQYWRASPSETDGLAFVMRIVLNNTGPVKLEGEHQRVLLLGHMTPAPSVQQFIDNGNMVHVVEADRCYSEALQKKFTHFRRLVTIDTLDKEAYAIAPGSYVQHVVAAPLYLNFAWRSFKSAHAALDRMRKAILRGDGCATVVVQMAESLPKGSKALQRAPDVDEKEHSVFLGREVLLRSQDGGTNVIVPVITQASLFHLARVTGFTVSSCTLVRDVVVRGQKKRPLFDEAYLKALCAGIAPLKTDPDKDALWMSWSIVTLVPT